MALLVCPVGVQAQSAPKSAAEQQFAEGRAARQRKDLDAARAAFTNVVSLVDTATGWQAGLKTLAIGNLALIARMQDRTDEAVTGFAQLHAGLNAYPGDASKVAGGPHDFWVIGATIDLARQYHHLKQTAEADYLFGRALAIDEAVFGPEHASVAGASREYAMFLTGENRNKDAEPLLKRALAIREKSSGPDDPQLADTLDRLGQIATAAHRDAEAQPLFARALAIREKAVGPDDPTVVDLAERLALADRTLKMSDDAITLLQRVVAIREKSGSGDSLAAALTLQRLGTTLVNARRPDDARPLLQRALALREANGRSDMDNAYILESLAILDRNAGRLAEADGQIRRAITLRETKVGGDHPWIATDLVTLATILSRNRRLTDAQPVLLRAIAIREKAFGADSVPVAEALEALSGVNRTLSRYDDAEQQLQRALAIREAVSTADDPLVAEDLDSLSMLYRNLRRYADAERLVTRAAAMNEARFGAESLALARRLADLGTVLQDAGRTADSAKPYQRAIAILEKVAPDSVLMAFALSNYGTTEMRLGHYPEATDALTRAVAIREKVLGPDHVSLGLVLARVAELYSRQSLFAEAEVVARRALAIEQRTLDPDDSVIALSFDTLSSIESGLGRIDDALDARRKAVAIRLRRIERGANDRLKEGATEQRNGRLSFLELLTLLAAKEATPDIVAEAFAAAQYSGGTETAEAVAAMAARDASGSDALGELSRRRQDLDREWQSLDGELLKQISQAKDDRDPALEMRLRTRIGQVKSEIDGVDAQLRADFPRFTELTAVRPVSLSDAQRTLQPQEALVVWRFGRADTFVFVIRKTAATFFRTDLAPADMIKSVRGLRNSLDQRGRMLVEMPPFDVGVSYRLYKALLQPAEPLLAGATSLLVVPGGAMQSLPPGVLVTAPPEHAIRDFGDYASVPWLIRRYAIAILPAVSSLTALRDLSPARRATEPFAGFGDPDFGPPDANAAKKDDIEVASLFRGVNANGAGLRRLPRLPETADELRAQARILAASPARVFLGTDATVSRVRSTDLANTKILAFATHGLIAGELPELAEPALVLSPPANPTADDDGLLRASQVSQLHLNADWVVLSACNTAASDGTPGAEGLSGLARAFFYAGARSILASHWPVNSETTVALTTGSFQALETNASIGRAEALRRSMIAMIDSAGRDNKPAYFAHPLFWAPFVLVGEGAPGR